MLKYKTRNKVAVEFFGCFLSWGFWLALGLVPFLGIILPHLIHTPELPQWFYWSFWTVMPIKKNFWKRVISPTILFLWDLAMIPTLWIVFPIAATLWEDFLAPVYKRWVKPYEERLIKPVAIPVFVFLLFYEEIVLWGLRKIVFPGVKWFIQIAPAWMILAIFATLEVGKIISKPMLFVAFGFGFLYGVGFLGVYVAISFFSLQIMVHGSEKIRKYAWFNKLYEWVVVTIGPIKDQAKKWWKSQPIYRWWKEAKENIKKNKNTFFARVVDRAKHWRRKKTD